MANWFSEMPPLVQALIVGDESQMLDCLNISQEKVDEPDKEYNRTPLCWAIKYRHFRIVQILVENGANVNRKVQGEWTPVELAIISGCTDIVNYLLEHGADITLDKTESALSWTEKDSYSDMVFFLKDFELKSNHPDKKENGLIKEFHENGNLSLRVTFKNGKRDGLMEEWHENGNLLYRAYFKDGIQDGLMEEWHENGNLSQRVNFKDGKKDGMWEE